MSPACRPARSAALCPALPKPSTFAPRISFIPATPASSAVTSLIWMPSTATRTRPCAMMSSMTFFASVIGIAKPYPALTPVGLAMALVIPITSPRELTSGPPEFPGLIAASVWMRSLIE